MCTESRKGASPAPGRRGATDADELTSAYAALARQERAAALRALAGQFAHQIRNGLAATHAACENLRAELDDPEHRQRLHLALSEMGHMLDSVSSTVHALAEKPESPRSFDVLEEVREVAQIWAAGRPDSAPLELFGDPVRCLLPRNGLRVAVYSLLDHLANSEAPAAAGIIVLRNSNRVKIRFTGRSAHPAEHPVAEDHWPAHKAVGAGLVGLLIAERFARNIGGRLSRSVNGEAALVLTLDIPLAAGA